MVAAEALTVCSVLWVGQFRKRRYGPEWVQRLRNMVARRLDLPHRFVCLSNVTVPGVETIPLPPCDPGWWAKIALHKPGLLTGRCLYLDLDTLITGDLRPIAEFPADIAFMPPSFVFGGGRPAGGPGIVDRYQTSCMVWDAGAGAAIWEEYTRDVPLQFRGDQDYISHLLPTCPTMPPEWFRKLRDCRDGPPPGVRVVLSMPDKNDVAAEKHEWVKRLWV